MSVLIVGAGAAGGYIGTQLISAGRKVRFLVHPHTLTRLTEGGLRLRHGAETQTVPVHAVTATELREAYDVIVLAVRTEAAESAIDDVHAAVGAQTRIVPILNGIGHLSLLSAAFGQDRVLGAATRLVASQSPDGTIDIVTPGIEMQIGQLDGLESDALHRTAAELAVPDIAVTLRSDIVAAMWEKFAFITSTAILTCLVGDEVGPIARAEGGIDLARRVLAEVAAVAEADGYPLAEAAHSGIHAVLTDPASTFGPSMFRDMKARRKIESTVLADLAGHARRHQISTPLLDTSIVVIEVHNRRLS